MLRTAAQSAKKAFHKRIPSLRAYHDDQPYLDLKPPTSPSAVNSLLPCPPSSPSSKRLRFSVPIRDAASLSPFRRATLSDVPLLGKVASRLNNSNSPALWVFLYFTLNLSLTLYNKYVLNHFPFPYTLTALHALCGTVGTFVMLHFKLASDPLPRLNFKESAVILAFSMLYTINILVSNASLKLVTVPFHQVVRASTPLFTIALSALLFRKGCSRAKLFSLVPVIIGVGFATYGDYYFTVFGFLLTLLGTLLAALKTIITNLFLRSSASPSAPTSITKASSSESTPSGGFPTKHEKVPAIFQALSQTDSQYRLTTAASRFSVPKLCLTPLQLLYLMSPLAFIQTTIMAHFTGELGAVNRHISELALSDRPSISFGFGLGIPNWWLLMNGVIAFALNIVSFNSNKRIGPLGMTVAANVKQVLTILCAVTLFNLTITLTNGLGIALTLVGGAMYAYVEVQEKQKTKRSG
ncbi:TPT-domain-containing protein [Coprinopsis marcescibilis]|uniref:TPT-domain-containing protein n=1 Tax=Coprinopsis marcescibilis TaxID=230819 RepID=A0A5C3L8S8_COPMA|nr:TPT-domain-containing protein [Coprinopsis marcescibilis]